MKTFSGIMTLAMLSAYPLAARLARAAQAPADLVLTGGKVYTANASHAMAEAVAVRGGRIVYVGASAGAKAYVGAGTRVDDLRGKLVLPGLIDSHIHPGGIVESDVCELKSEAKSLAEITAFVRGCIERYRIPAGEWVNVQQWNFSNGNLPDAQHPDAAGGARPGLHAPPDPAARQRRAPWRLQQHGTGPREKWRREGGRLFQGHARERLPSIPQAHRRRCEAASRTAPSTRTPAT